MDAGKLPESHCRAAGLHRAGCPAAKQICDLGSCCEALLPRWLQDRLAVIPTVYRQQKEMYDNHSHSCEDRIVSLEQPHVRPIQRGKRPYPTEFGQKLHLSVVDGYTYLEQTPWKNFNEGSDLEAAVEDYTRKFGCYPARFLPTGSIKPEPTNSTAKSLEFACPGPLWAAERPTKQMRKSNGRCTSIPVNATRLRAAAATLSGVSDSTAFSLNWMRRLKLRPLSFSLP